MHAAKEFKDKGLDRVSGPAESQLRYRTNCSHSVPDAWRQETWRGEENPAHDLLRWSLVNVPRPLPVLTTRALHARSGRQRTDENRLAGLAAGRRARHLRSVRRARQDRRWRAGNVALRFVACVVLAFVTPGVEEALADVAHVLMDGHSFHDEGHEAPDHCCSGAFHVCGCHASIPAILTARMTIPAPVPLPNVRTMLRPWTTGAPTDGYARETQRPPRA